MRAWASTRERQSYSVDKTRQLLVQHRNSSPPLKGKTLRPYKAQGEACLAWLNERQGYHSGPRSRSNKRFKMRSGSRSCQQPWKCCQSWGHKPEQWAGPEKRKKSSQRNGTQTLCQRSRMSWIGKRCRPVRKSQTMALLSPLSKK